MVKNLSANTGDIGDVGLIPGWGRCPRGENGNPLQYSCLVNSTDGRAGRLQSTGSQRVRHDRATNTHTTHSKGNVRGTFWKH